MKEFFSANPYYITTGGAEPMLTQDTIGNFTHALRLGSEGIRTNVSPTRDGTLVLYSDAVFENPVLRKKGTAEFDHARLRELHLDFLRNSGDPAHSSTGRGDLFPLLEDALKSLPSCRFNFNLLGEGAAEPFSRMIERTASPGRVLVSSYSGAIIRTVRALIPGAATSFSFAGLAGFYALHRSGLIYFRKKFAADALVMPEAMGISFLAGAALVREARARGLRVYVLGVNSLDMARRLGQAGVDGIITNSLSIMKDPSG